MKITRVFSYTETNVTMYDGHCLKKFMGDREARVDAVEARVIRLFATCVEET